jgi:hypothetical protein
LTPALQMVDAVSGSETWPRGIGSPDSVEFKKGSVRVESLATEGQSGDGSV